MYKRKYGMTVGGPAIKKLKAQIRRNRAPKAYRTPVKGAIKAYGGAPELKFVDTACTDAANICDTTGFAEPVNLLAVGDDNTTRDGRQVTIKSVQIRGMLSRIDQTGTLNCLCRMMLVWDNANNSVATTSANLIAALMTASRSDAFPNVDNQNRFTVLWEHQFAMGSLQTTATQTFSDGNATEAINYYKKINQVAQYSGTTAAIGSIQSGALWLVTLGNQASTDCGVFLGNVRVRFCDN